tara:strand:+ start:213 stop:398 length:186 start_codon:yes stop_codon:yes gene_type:complete
MAKRKHKMPAKIETNTKKCAECDLKFSLTYYTNRPPRSPELCSNCYKRQHPDWNADPKAKV